MIPLMLTNIVEIFTRNLKKIQTSEKKCYSMGGYKLYFAKYFEKNIIKLIIYSGCGIYPFVRINIKTPQLIVFNEKQ